MTFIKTSYQHSGQKLWIVLFAVALALFLLLAKAATLFTEWLWFKEVGYQMVFNVTMLAKLKAGALFGVFLFLLVYLNAFIALHFSKRPLFVDPAGTFPLPFREIKPNVLKLLALFGALLMAFLSALNGSSQYENLLLFLNSSSFGLVDPLLGKDISFYVFQLPLLAYLNGWFNFTIILTIATTALIYLVRRSFLFLPPRLWRVSPPARIHLSILAALFFFWGIFSAWIDLNELLFIKRGVVFGPGYTDVNTQVWILKLMMLLYGLSGLSLVFHSFRPDWRIPAGAIVLLAVVSFVGRGIYPSIVQKFQVIPNEVTLETPYIEKNIHFTRFAYGLDKIEEKEFPAEDSLTAADIEKNNMTIKNIRLWNHAPLLQTYSQLQEMRTYYKFTGVDNDRYTINGEYRQVMLSPREISYRALPSRTWVNEHLTYTHGYGAVMGPVNSISPEGLPEFFIKDIPPVATTPVKITRPEIYFGENSNDYVFVKAKTPEFDYPVGDKNVYNRYEGKGGIPLTFFRKLLFAIRFGSATLLLSDDITSETRILYHRNVLERVSMIAPFARLDDDPYLVISADGRLFWFIDGYTVTNRFPYSEPTPGIGNYIRNSLKAVVNAYDGTVNIYVSNSDDPVIKTYGRIFPGVFKPVSELSPEMRSHIRYPAELMSIQARMYRAYHMRDARVFYNKEDIWSIPGKQTAENSRTMDPYYTIMKLPETDKEEFVLLSPFTPSMKDNMSAWMAARCDESNYGKVIIYKFPKQKLVYGPNQIEARIDQDAVISQQLSLWHQRGSNVIRGSLLAIPIDKSILYVESLYLAAENGQLPELKRVIVANGNNIAMEETLDSALRKVFGRISPSGKKGLAEQTKNPSPVVFEADRRMISEALGHYRKSQEMLRQGNWGAFGEEIKITGDILNALNKKVENQK